MQSHILQKLKTELTSQNQTASVRQLSKTDERARSTKQSANKHDTQWTDILGAAPSDTNREVERKSTHLTFPAG